MRILPCWLLLAFAAATPGRAHAQAQSKEQLRDLARVEMPYKNGVVVLTSETINRVGTRYQATGQVRITYQDMVLTCEGIEYDEITQQGITVGNTHFVQNKAWLNCSHAEFDFSGQTATFHDASGYTDEEFLVQGQMVVKTGPSTYTVEKGLLTSCQEKRPKWEFSVGKANIRIDKTARLHRVSFRIKGIPVLYFPYLIIPMEAKKRSSGLIPFHLGNSNIKGRQLTFGYYQTLGPSAEATWYGDYFTKRGFGMGGIFRARPNEQTRLSVEAFGVNDRLGQGGAHILVDGDTLLANGFRAAAKVNITTNFAFRQIFSEGFRSATIPEEQALVFASRPFDSFAANFSYERREVFFPSRSLVLRRSPAIEFVSLGKALGGTPLIISFRAAAEGLLRSDSVFKTPDIVQRLDFFPRIALRLPALAGFAFQPSFGLRETYYSAHLTGAAKTEVVASPLQRQYTEFQIEMRPPGLEKSYGSSGSGIFRHLVEPSLTYRRINGITRARDIIRFDDQDALADTNEIEYGIVNRIMRSREVSPGLHQDYEFLAFDVRQKYYFDPSFGGAFVTGESNLFYPLNTLSGFSATGIHRNISPTSFSLRINPGTGVYYDLRADYDAKLGRLRDASFWAVWRRNQWLISGTYFKANALEPSLFEAHHVQSQLAYRDPNQNGFSGSFTMSYNIQSRDLLNSSSRLNYSWNCCGVAMEFQQYALGLRRESRLTFSFNLKGIGHFGNLKRPESLF
jgi:LPS-assembly protein